MTGPSEPLTTNAIEDHDPVFTPDGQSIIWSQGEGNARELKRIDLGSREVVTLTSDDVQRPRPGGLARRDQARVRRHPRRR